MCDVEDVGCSGCGMFAGMWDVDLQNAIVRIVSTSSKVPTDDCFSRSIYKSLHLTVVLQ